MRVDIQILIEVKCEEILSNRNQQLLCHCYKVIYCWRKLSLCFLGKISLAKTSYTRLLRKREHTIQKPEHRILISSLPSICRSSSTCCDSLMECPMQSYIENPKTRKKFSYSPILLVTLCCQYLYGIAHLCCLAHWGGAGTTGVPNQTPSVCSGVQTVSCSPANVWRWTRQGSQHVPSGLPENVPKAGFFAWCASSWIYTKSRDIILLWDCTMLCGRW